MSLSEQPFERHKALASWIERLANSQTGLSLGEWMVFVGSLNAALIAEGAQTRTDVEPVACLVCNGDCSGANPPVAGCPRELTADFVRALPGGTLDDSEYEKIEDALDRLDAPCTAPNGRWLKLHERVAALAPPPTDAPGMSREAVALRKSTLAGIKRLPPETLYAMLVERAGNDPALAEVILGLYEACNDAVADREDDAAQAPEGERTDLWEPPEVSVPVPNLRAILALASLGGRLGEDIPARADLSRASSSPTPSDLEDEIADALQDSLGPDWTCRDGAKAVVRLLEEARHRPSWPHRMKPSTYAEAVEPFLRLAREVINPVNGERPWHADSKDWMVVFSFGGHSITLGDLRRAAAVQASERPVIAGEDFLDDPLPSPSPVRGAGEEEKVATERLAQEIYEGWAREDGYVPWVVGGNSIRQDEARKLARARLETPAHD